MKHVQESLYQFKDAKFFNSLLEEEKLSPAERKKKKEELQRQGFSVVQKCIKNFAAFKKNAGDIWQEYRDFWSSQKEADESVQQKGLFYNLWESDYIVGVVKEPDGNAALKVYNTSQSDPDEYVAFSSTNPNVVKAFKEFIQGDHEYTMKTVVDNQKAAMEAKKAADAARQKEEAAASKKAKLDAFLGESAKSKKKLNEGTYEDFFMNYSLEIKNALEILKQLAKKFEKEELEEDDLVAALEKLEKIYDTAVTEFIAGSIYAGGYIDARDLANTALDNMNRQGTEMQMILFAIDDLGGQLGVSMDYDD